MTAYLITRPEIPRLPCPTVRIKYAVTEFPALPHHHGVQGVGTDKANGDEAALAVSDLGSNMVENWMVFTVLMLFFWVLSVKRTITDIASDVTQAKIGMVAIINYLNITV